MTAAHHTTELRCLEPDCSRWHVVQTKHLDNLLAAGPWRCPDHAPGRDVGRTDIKAPGRAS